jgi:hypothetical protein
MAGFLPVTQRIRNWTKRDDAVVPLSPPPAVLAKFPDALRMKASKANPYKPKQQSLDFPMVRVPNKRFSPPSHQPRMSIPKGVAGLSQPTDSPGAVHPRGSR